MMDLLCFWALGHEQPSDADCLYLLGKVRLTAGTTPGLRSASCGSRELSFIDLTQPVKALLQTFFNVSHTDFASAGCT